MTVGTGEEGCQDGAAAEAMFRTIFGMLHLPDASLFEPFRKTRKTF